MKRAALGRLLGALEGVKARDAARLRASQDRLSALDAERASIAARIQAAAPSEETDLRSRAAYERWRMDQERRLEALDARRVDAVAEMEALRETLLVSNGEAEAATRLVRGL